ncbi:9770_t:CDS:1, partial [Racocetra persica]
IHEVLSNINFYENNDYDKELIDEKRSVNDKDIQDNFMLPEKELFKIEELLNLDITDFIDSLGEIIIDTNFEFLEENIGQNNNTKSNNKKDWNSEREINTMLD